MRKAAAPAAAARERKKEKKRKPEWVQSFSDSRKKVFWKNTQTGERTWKKPEGVPIHDHRSS